MTGKQMIVSCFVIVIVLFLHVTLGCHYGKKRNEYGGEFERRKRSVGAPDARKDLSDFFTTCMIRKVRPGVIPVMRSVVDFALRDTIWYKASDTYFCTGYQDNFGCWQGIMDLLTDWDSELLGPTRECVLEYSTGSKTGGYRQKRSTRDQTYGDDETQSYTCPQVSDEEYGSCITYEVNNTSSYPSLEYFHWDSIAIFVRQHMSRCRIEEFTETWNDQKQGYKRNCGNTRYKGPNGERVETADEQCLPQILLEVIKEDSPLTPSVELCNAKYENLTEIKIEKTFENLIIVDEIIDDETEKTIYGPRGMHKGADFLGNCHDNANFSRWFDNFSPNGTGDKELLVDIKRDYPGHVPCNTPDGIQIRISRNNKPWFSSHNNLVQSNATGLECQDSMQQPGKKCENFKVRFCCNEREGQDNIKHVHPYPKTKDTVGTCEDKDDWSQWMNIDKNKDDGGEFETFRKSRLTNCEPVAVQGRTARNERPYTEAHNNIRTATPTEGIVCSDDMQPKENPCVDLEVRFCCKDGKGTSKEIQKPKRTPTRKPQSVLKKVVT